LSSIVCFRDVADILGDERQPCQCMGVESVMVPE
jgi:hypothetical protein